MVDSNLIQILMHLNTFIALAVTGPSTIVSVCVCKGGGGGGGGEEWHSHAPFAIPWVMGAIESLGCNWWSNMHQIDA